MERRFVQGGSTVNSWKDIETTDSLFSVGLRAEMKKQWADGPLPLIETPWHTLVNLDHVENFTNYRKKPSKLIETSGTRHNPIRLQHRSNRNGSNSQRYDPRRKQHAHPSTLYLYAYRH